MFWYYIKVNKFKDFDYGSFINKHESKIKHIVQVLWYNEATPIIEETIEYISNSQIIETSKKVILCIAMEQRSKDIDLKMKDIIEKYGNDFLDIIFTIHPSDIPNETRGACSNVTFSTKEIYKYLLNKYGDTFDDKEYLLTKFDTDTLIHPKYLACLEYNYLNQLQSNNNECDTIFVPKLCYEYSLNQAYWFVRVLGRFRTFCYNYLNIFDLMIVTIYSIPLNLHYKGGFQCSYNLSEEPITWLKYSIFLGKKIKIKVIPMYIVNGITSGTTLTESISEMGKQYYRWSIGWAQLMGIILKYTFTFNLSFKEVMQWFILNMIFLPTYLMQNSITIFIFISHWIHIIYYSRFSFVGFLGAPTMPMLIFWVYQILTIIIVSFISKYFIANGIIYLSKERKKESIKPLYLTVMEMSFSLIPISIGNLYTVKSYIDAIIYGESVYGHVASKKTLN